MAQVQKAKRVVIKAKPEGAPKLDDFEIKEVDLPALEDGQVLFKSLYISPDPYQRGRLNQLNIGDTMAGSSVAEVVESKNPGFKVGDLLVPYQGWVSHGIIGDAQLKTTMRHLPALGPASTALGVLGMPGMTSYFGLLRVCEPKAGEIVVVSGAAGAVGSLVGQIAKIKGCTVIGFAGSDTKCEYIKSLGFDHAVNYNTCGSQKAALDKLAPDGIDCYFDNVGGETLDAVMMSLKPFARIAICGQISEYNNLGKPSTGPRLFWNLIYKNAKIEGFVSSRWSTEWPEGIQQMSQWIAEGKIKYTETIDEGGIEATPKAFISMLAGGNTGKQLVKL